MDPLTAFIQIMQALAAPLTLLVAVTTLKGRSDDKNTMLVEMRKDIEHIRENTACIPAQTTLLTQHQSEIENLKRRMDEHVALYHGQKKEDTP